MNKISASLLAITIIMGSANLAKAQDSKPVEKSTKWLIGITGGISAPSGNFTKTDYDNGSSGFAGSGYNMGITSTWFIKKHFGITALASYHHYSYKGIQNIADGFHEAFDVDSASATTRGSNHSINILIGPAYSLPVSRKVAFDFRVLAGVVDATLAGWDVVLTDADITHPALTQNTSHVATFGMQAGAAIKYSITKQWAILLNGDYFYSKPNFSIVNIDRNANAGREITSYNQAIAGINANLTLAYCFKRK